MQSLRFLIFLAGAALSTMANTIVVPNGLVHTDGSGASTAPFLYNTTHTSASETMRYQQVYDSSQFPSFAMEITGIWLRPDVNGGAFDFTFPQIDIRLSTTSTEPGSLSLNFADNVGADETLVHSGELRIDSAHTGPADGPKNFDIGIPFSAPFRYDPSMGNLLLDIRNYGNVSPLATYVYFYMDVHQGPYMSRAFSWGSGGVNAAQANTTDNVGLVTLFQYQVANEYPPLDPRPDTSQVPEPLSCTLVALGLGGIALRARR